MTAVEMVEARRRRGLSSHMKVIHPVYGIAFVKAFSPFDASLQAAIVWHCDWMDIKDDVKVYLPSKQEELDLQEKEKLRVTGRPAG